MSGPLTALMRETMERRSTLCGVSSLLMLVPLALGRRLASTREKRIRIVLTRDLEAKQFGDALLAGLEKNHEPAELAALKPATDALIGALAAVGEVASGTEIVLDQLANGATRLVVNGQQKGDDIGDVAFYPALLRIWLGVRPADHDLRDALLRQSR